MNWVDTPLLVYQAVAGHPAKATVEGELRYGAWASTLLVLSECYQVLEREYRFTPSAAAAAVERLAHSPMHWAAVDRSHMVAVVAERERSRLESADAALLLLAQADRGTLVTQDQRLLRVGAAQGIAVRNPITPDLAVAIARWEEQHLPPKGLARLLQSIEEWLRRRAPEVADDFLADTARLSRLP